MPRQHPFYLIKQNRPQSCVISVSGYRLFIHEVVFFIAVINHIFHEYLLQLSKVNHLGWMHIWSWSWGPDYYWRIVNLNLKMLFATTRPSYLGPIVFNMYNNLIFNSLACGNTVWNLQNILVANVMLPSNTKAPVKQMLTYCQSTLAAFHRK